MILTCQVGMFFLFVISDRLFIKRICLVNEHDRYIFPYLVEQLALITGQPVVVVGQADRLLALGAGEDFEQFFFYHSILRLLFTYGIVCYLALNFLKKKEFFLWNERIFFYSAYFKKSFQK